MTIGGPDTAAEQSQGDILYIRYRSRHFAELDRHQHRHSAHCHQCRWLAQRPHLVQISPEAGRHWRRMSGKPHGGGHGLAA